MNQKVLVSNSGYPRRRKRFLNKLKVVTEAVKQQEGEFSARDLTLYIRDVMNMEAEVCEVRHIIPRVEGVKKTHSFKNKNDVDKFTYFGPEALNI
jgi:hypothetical protein